MTKNLTNFNTIELIMLKLSIHTLVLIIEFIIILLYKVSEK